MKKLVLVLGASVIALSTPSLAAVVNTASKLFSSDGVIATVDSYPTLESSIQFLKNQEKVGVNKFVHRRQLTPTDQQPVVRMNRDTYYSMATVDVSKGATITLPQIEAGKYMSLQVVTEDHRTPPMQYGSGTFNLSTHIGKHVYALVRLDGTYSEPEARKLQDAMVISAISNNEFVTEQINKESFKKIEKELKAQMPKIFERDGDRAMEGMFTSPNDESKELFTKEKYTVGAAIGWAGPQMVDNIYEVSGNYQLGKCYQATFEDPENKAFWSVTVYNKQGFMFSDFAHVNSSTAKKNSDGTYTVSFGCGVEAPNNIETNNESGVFNLGIRHYIPSQRVLNGYRLLSFVKTQ